LARVFAAMKGGHNATMTGEDAAVNRFAFVMHPLSLALIHKDPRFGWTRRLPDGWVESVAAHLPPLYLGRMTGGRSPVTGQTIEGLLFSLGATPRQMLSRCARFTYDGILRAADKAAQMGARILGLGAFTKVVGDAGITVARQSPIPVTSGNSLTIAATLESAKQAVRAMGRQDLSRGRAMVVGATGAIGSVCSRLLAQATGDVALVSIEPERLAALAETIRRETPGARVETALAADELLGDCDLIVTATSAFGQRVVDLSRAKPGAVICDVALPSDIGA
jgi:predicted amino acid dehydrogenase